MIKLSQKSEEKIIEELKWRFNLTEVEIRDTLEKTVEYLNNIQVTLQIEDPQQVASIAEKLIKIN